MDNTDNFETQENTAKSPSSGEPGVTFGDNDYFKKQFEIYNKQQTEKKSVKAIASLTCIPLLIVFGISYFWSSIYYFIAGKLGFSKMDAYNFAVDPGATQVFQIFLSSVMFTVPFIIILKIARKTVSETVPFGKPKTKLKLPMFMLGLSFCFFSSVMVSFSGSIFESFGIDYNVDFGDSPYGLLGMILTAIATAVVPALVEEFSMRGVILGSLLPFGEGFAIMTSSIIFGILHGNFDQMPFAFLVGLILGYIRVKTDSLWICIFIHFANNFISVINDYLKNYISSEAISYLYYFMICIFFVLGIISIIKISSNKDFDAFHLSNRECKIEAKSKYKWYFASVPFIIFAIIYIGKSIKYFF